MKNVLLLLCRISSRAICYALCCTLLFFSCNSVEPSQTSSYIFHVKQKDLTIFMNDQQFPWTINEDKLNFPYAEKGNEIRFASPNDTLQFTLPPDSKFDISFIINKTDTVHAVAVGKSKPVSFSDEYISKHTGTYKVFCPEVHELVNISIALTDIGRLDSNMIDMETDYYQKVRKHFDAYSEHPLIDSLNQYITEVFGSATYNYYYALKMDACMYTFTKGGDLQNLSPYNRLGFGSENPVAHLQSEFEDFARVSHFATFFQENKSYYQSLIEDYHRLVPIKKMWEWAEKKFPQRYQSYSIYFSPLVGGAHATQNYSDNDFKETVMFVNAPTLTEDNTELEKEGILTRIVFTEIDHNYVNPTSDTYPETGTVMDPLDCWNNGTQGYQSSYETFNEYMTWAIFTLYLYDHFDPTFFSKRNEIESNFMEESRGFIKYSAFNDFVLDWYKSNPNEPLKNLFPQVLSWINSQPC